VDHALETIFGEGEVVRVALVGKDQLELWIIDEIVDLGEVLVIVGVFGLENEFEQLEVKDGLVGVGVLVEKFDGAVLIDEVVFEERGVFFCLGEQTIAVGSVLSRVAV
jgi:hypothetical protein